MGCLLVSQVQVWQVHGVNCSLRDSLIKILTQSLTILCSKNSQMFVKITK